MMPLNAQFEACAKLDGWKRHTKEGFDSENYSERFTEKGWIKNGGFVRDRPNYDSYDVLIPAIRKWCEENVWSLFYKQIREIEFVNGSISPRVILMMEPEQLRIAWLKAAGVWKEE